MGRLFLLPVNLLCLPVVLVCALLGKLTWQQFGRLCWHSLPCVD
jgi:hypothetical protein